MARPKKGRRVCAAPHCTCFGPADAGESKQLDMTLDEYETVRLIDLEGLTQKACAAHMQIARSTVQTIYQHARQKLAQCIVEAVTLTIQGGDYHLCEHTGQCAGACCQGQLCNHSGTRLAQSN